MNIPDLISMIRGSKRHRCLYHFTDERNLPTIVEHGLCPKSEFEQVGVKPNFPGGNDISWKADKLKCIFGYVSLCLTQDHPMCYIARQDGRINTARYLRVSPSVLAWEGVKFAQDIANKKGVPIQPLAASIANMDLDVLYNWTDWTDQSVKERLGAVKRYEILVPHIIPVDLIRGYK